MTGQFEWPIQPQPHQTPAYVALHDDLLAPCGGHVPGTKRPYRHSAQAREARAVLDALNARITVREEDAADEGFLPGIDDVPDWVREGLDR